MGCSLTIHTMVKNEPFVYYAVRSVYDYSDVIMLWDTGSSDRYTLSDIERLLDEDVDKKIDFRHVPIEIDQTIFTHENQKECADTWKGTFGLGSVRQMQIDDTKTDYFMLVDGDEVHYNGTIKRIKSEVLPSLDGDLVWARIPYYNFCGIEQILGDKKAMGRIYKTSEIAVTKDFPELHYVKKVGRPTRFGNCMRVNNLRPFAHFETYLKPWRRPSMERARTVRPAPPIPEVMVKEPSYIERFEETKTNE